MHISELASAPRREPARGRPAGRRGARKILEIDSERRRLSLSVKRVEDQILPRAAPRRRRPSRSAGDLDDVPELGLSEDVFAPPAPR